MKFAQSCLHWHLLWHMSPLSYLVYHVRNPLWYVAAASCKGSRLFLPLLEEVPQQGCLAPILLNFCSQSPLVILASAFYDAFFLSKLTAQLEYIIQFGGLSSAHSSTHSIIRCVCIYFSQVVSSFSNLLYYTSRDLRQQ